MPHSVIIINGKTLVEVNDVLMELQEAVDFLARRTAADGLPDTAKSQPEYQRSRAGRSGHCQPAGHQRSGGSSHGSRPQRPDDLN